MRAFGCFILGVAAAVLVIAFGLFAMENGQAITFSFLGNTMRMGLWLIVGIPAVIGFLLALLLVTPARAAGDRHGTVLQQRYRSLERDLADERERNAQMRVENSRLQARYDQTLAERDNLNTRLATVQQAVTAPAEGTPVATAPVRETPPVTTAAQDTPVETAPVHETPVASTPVREMPTVATPARDAAAAQETPAVTTPAQDAPGVAAPMRETAAGDTMVYNETPGTVQHEEPMAPVASDRVPEQQAVTTDERVQSGPVAQPRLGERLRGMFGGQRTAEEEESDRLNSRGPAPTM